MAVLFPTGYNFTNTTMDNNAYFVSADAQHFIGKAGTTTGTGMYLFDITSDSKRTIERVVKN